MSLLNLLTVGNSFSAVENHPSRYKMIRENLLPHFNPVSNRCDPAAFAPAPDRTAPAVTAEGERGSAPAAPRFSKRTAVCPEAAEPVRTGPAAYPRGRWSVRPFLALGRKPAEQPEAGPVQNELPWEEVPVARNDLNDGDLEIVSAADRAGGLEADPARAAEAARRLERVGERGLTGANK